VSARRTAGIVQKRRPKGSGTLYQRRDGLWVAEITRAGVVTRRTAATEELAEARLRVALGSAAPMRVSDPTVADYLRSWVEACPRLSDKTRFGYRRIIELYLVPSIGAIRVRELRAPDVKRMLAEMRAARKSSGTQRNARNCLSGAMGDALEDGLIEFNPARVKVATGVNAASSVSIGLNEAASLLDALKFAPTEHHMYDLWALMLYTGGRLGEVLGLDWADVRLHERKLIVRRQDSKIVDPEDATKLVRGFTRPKTTSGMREIPLAEEAVRLLEDRRARMGNPREGLIFPSVRDPLKPINPTDAHHRFQDALRFWGRPVIRQHDLRHYCASLLIGKGVPITTVSHILGHRNAAITESIYAHVITEAAKQQVEVLRFFPEVPSAQEVADRAHTPHEVGPTE
jgi:integrase